MCRSLHEDHCPCSTLAQSPTFTSAVDEASGEYGEWVQERRTYEESSQTKLTFGLAGVMGMYYDGIERIQELEARQQEFDQISEGDILAKKQAARELIRHAVKISREIMKEEEDDDDGKEYGAAPSEGKDGDQPVGWSPLVTLLHAFKS